LKKNSTTINIIITLACCLQCFDTVGWVSGRVSGL